MGGRKICTICEEEKKEKYFYKNRRQCIPCYKKRCKDVLASNGDIYERLICLDSRMDRLENKIDESKDLMLAVLDMVNKMHLSKT